MSKIVNNLKKKPAHVRDQIAIFAAITFAGVVTFFWLTSLTSEYASPEAKKSFSESFSPFKLFGNNVKSALDRSKAELSTINTPNEMSGDQSSVTVDDQGVVNLGAQPE